MTIKTIYDSQDDIPEAFIELYTQKGEAWELTGVEGMKTQADIDRVQVSLKKERAEHKENKSKYAKWKDVMDSGLEAEDVTEKLDRFDELEAAASGKIDEDKINSMVEARLKSKLTPLEREKNALAEKVGTLEAENTGYVTANKTRKIHDELRKVAISQKVLPEAMEDVLLIGERNFEMTDDGLVLTNEYSGSIGLTPETWIQDVQAKRPYWWPASQGGGAGGSTPPGGAGKNPFTAANWSKTAQANLITEKGIDHANKLADQAGSSVSATRPPESKK